MYSTYKIEGMHCGSCETKIRKALLDLDSILDATVSAKSGTAQIQSDDTVQESSIRDAIASAGNYRVMQALPTQDYNKPSNTSESHTLHAPVDEKPNESLYPLFLIVGFITGVTLLVAASTQSWNLEPMMRHFMAGFFLVFSFFKLLDLPGFVSAYRGYDLIARKVATWGWAYPFVELTLGVSYLMGWAPIATNTVTLILMLVGAAGVLKALMNKQTIRCACLGTALNLPMTKVTLIEDLTMAIMAGAMLVLMITS